MSLWALVDSNNIVLRVESATSEWVAEWQRKNPNSTVRYMPTDPESRDYAGIGWAWDETRERFMPPMPEIQGEWIYDEDVWGWADLSPQPEPPMEPEVTN